MNTYLRLTDGNIVNWVIERRHNTGVQYRIIASDCLVFSELSAPCGRRREIYSLTVQELLDCSHFGNGIEQGIMLHAFADMLTIDPDTKFNVEHELSFRRCINYCTGQEVL